MTDGLSQIASGNIGEGLKSIGKTSSFAGSLLILLGLPVFYYFNKKGIVTPKGE